MNKIENTKKEDFYISDSNKCAYKPDQEERKLFTFIKGSKNQDFYNLLISKGSLASGDLVILIATFATVNSVS